MSGKQEALSYHSHTLASLPPRRPKVTGLRGGGRPPRTCRERVGRGRPGNRRLCPSRLRPGCPSDGAGPTPSLGCHGTVGVTAIGHFKPPCNSTHGRPSNKTFWEDQAETQAHAWLPGPQRPLGCAGGSCPHLHAASPPGGLCAAPRQASLSSLRAGPMGTFPCGETEPPGDFPGCPGMGVRAPLDRGLLSEALPTSRHRAPPDSAPRARGSLMVDRAGRALPRRMAKPAPLLRRRHIFL